MTMSFYGDEMTPDEHKALVAAQQEQREYAIVQYGGNTFDPSGDTYPQGEGLRQTIRSLVDSVFGGTATSTVSWDSRTVPGWTEGMIKFVTVLLSPESYNNFFKGEAYVTARATYELHGGKLDAVQRKIVEVVVCPVGNYPSRVGGKPLITVFD
jgi:hypothetical protein